MSKISAQISQNYRYFFYAMLSLSFITGSGFWLLKTFAMQEGDFGPESHFLQYPFLQLHGLAAFVMLMSLGAIFASHVPKNWRYQRGKKTGIAILSAVSFSMITAYSLYYLVSEDWHTMLANSHAIIGLMLPTILFIHIKLARQSKAKNYQLKTQRKQEKRNQYKQKKAAKKQLIATQQSVDINSENPQASGFEQTNTQQVKS